MNVTLYSKIKSKLKDKIAFHTKCVKKNLQYVFFKKENKRKENKSTNERMFTFSSGHLKNTSRCQKSTPKNASMLP